MVVHRCAPPSRGRGSVPSEFTSSGPQPSALTPTHPPPRPPPPCPSPTNAQTHETSELKVIDQSGNPIIVRGLLEFGVEDAAALHIATNSSFAVLFNMAEQVRCGAPALP